MLPITYPVDVILHAFGSYLLVMLIFLLISVGLHETGHIIFARYHGLEYKISFQKGNLSVCADWKTLGNKKVYGHLLGIIFGLPPAIVGGWLYPTPIFLLVYLLACFDDFGAIAMELQNYKKIFCLLLL